MQTFKLIFCVFYFLKVSYSKKSEIPVSEFLVKELEAAVPACSLTKLTKAQVQGKWLIDQASPETKTCILKYLEQNPAEGWAWSLLGSWHDNRQEKTKGDFSFRQATKLTGRHSQFVADWSFIGPFPIGKSEFDGDPLAAYGGIRNVSKYRYQTKPAGSFYSEIVKGGGVSWSGLKQKAANDVVVVSPKVDWNELISALGSLGITEWQGWAVGQMLVNEDMLLSYQCLGVARCFLGPTLIAGDLYFRKDFQFPVALPRGVHSVFVPLRSKVTAKFRFSVLKVPNFTVNSPMFLPDIQWGHLPSNAFLPVPVSNQMGNRWLKIIKVKVESQSDGEKLEVNLLNKMNEIAPGQTKVIALHLKLSQPSQDSQLTSHCHDVTIDILMKTSEGQENIPVTLRCRNKKNSFLFTFVDHDGSIQHAAAIEPIGTCAGHQCPTFLTLHGTTVPPQNQADSYKKMVKGEFQFGVHKMWLLAPTRHGAHNWEGPGALTAMSALTSLSDMTKASTWLETTADPTHVLFAGHSMGGHGAWHLATHYPDRAIGLISLASWIKKEEYGDSNLFFKHDVATSHTDPSLKAVMEACVGENDADRHISNLKGVPVLVRIGAEDRTVHPYYVRRMLRLLTEQDISVTYSELPGQEHWWWDTKATNDGGCVNDEQVRTFISTTLSSVSSPIEGSCSKDGEGCWGSSDTGMYKHHDTYTLVTVNPAVGEGLKGVRVLQQMVPFRASTVGISLKDGSVGLTTKNVQCLEITKDIPNRNKQLENIEVYVIDGDVLDLKKTNAPFIFCFVRESKGGHWRHVPDLFSNDSVRGPHNLGPARRIAERQLVIIIGTQSDQLTTQLLTRHAAYIANQFLLTSDTVVTIKEDTTLDESQLEPMNLIILGSPKENSWTEKYLNRLKDLHISYDQGSNKMTVQLGSLCLFSADRTGLFTLAPHGQGLALLMMSPSPEGLEDVVNLATPTIPPMARSPFSNLLPDFVITGPDIGLKGPGGFECAGFWDNHWSFSTNSASCVCS
ncbi:uncharacterized protein LOC131936940 [Physella acuta]|uniref:uncharacterized protein LOC131936940 n=1 Tax=Physella acuta TaxID=109671 RepID=UPI0027DD5D4D|nr:uncharacterized protein LOC131936940 [Physella acuta]